MFILMVQAQEQQFTERPSLDFLQVILEESVKQHRHLCPRQVLGARIGLYGLKVLGLTTPDYSERFDNKQKRLLTFAETDGCGADGIAAATSCYVGRRTLRIVDYGKVAATVVDTVTGKSVRVWPSPAARSLAEQFAPHEKSRWHAYLRGYQLIPDEALLQARPVQLSQSIAQIISKPNLRVLCAACGEEVMNEREVVANGRLLCQACSGNSYYVT